MASNNQKASEPKTIRDSDLKRLRIMVVDDQPDTLQMILKMLKVLGVTEIFSAPDGREALQLIDFMDGMIDIVFCDWNMPNVTGIEMLRELRMASPDIRFIMVTARGDMDSVLVAKEAGVNGFIRKPFSLSELKNKIGAVMNQPLDSRAARPTP